MKSLRLPSLTLLNHQFIYLSIVGMFMTALPVKNTLTPGEYFFSSLTATLPVPLNERTPQQSVNMNKMQNPNQDLRGRGLLICFLRCLFKGGLLL